MTDDRSPLYDSFVIRIWQKPVDGHLLRAEIDHVQSGAVLVGRDVDSAWILDTLRTALRAHAKDIALHPTKPAIPDIPDG